MTIPDKAVEAALDAWIWTPKSTADIKMAMRAALAAAEQAMWEPIESAPKDGTTVLLTGGQESLAGFWQQDWMVHWHPTVSEPDRKPTHWRPLPPPPEMKK